MRFHVQFLERNHKNEVVEALGSDGVLILDGSNKTATMMDDAMHRFCKMRKHLHTSYCGWRIKKGDRFDNSKTIKEYILPNGD